MKLLKLSMTHWKSKRSKMSRRRNTIKLFNIDKESKKYYPQLQRRDNISIGARQFSVVPISGRPIAINNNTAFRLMRA